MGGRKKKTQSSGSSQLSCGRQTMNKYINKYVKEICNTPSVSVSQGCHNKVPQTEWLKTTDIYFLIVLKLTVQNQGFGHAMFSPKSIGGEPYLPLPAACSPGVPWLVATQLQFLPPSSNGTFLVYFPVFSHCHLHIRTPVIIDQEPLFSRMTSS